MKQSELLERSYKALLDTYHDEKCDHSVGICYCDIFGLLNNLNIALLKIKERRRNRPPTRKVPH